MLKVDAFRNGLTLHNLGRLCVLLCVSVCDCLCHCVFQACDLSLYLAASVTEPLFFYTSVTILHLSKP